MHVYDPDYPPHPATLPELYLGIPPCRMPAGAALAEPLEA